MLQPLYLSHRGFDRVRDGVRQPVDEGADLVDNVDTVSAQLGDLGGDVALDEHIEPDPVAVEPLSGSQVGGREHHVNRVFG